MNIKRNLLTLPQAIGLLQRFMPQRNAAQWLENDRRHNPLISFLQKGDLICYYEDELIAFALKLSPNTPLRQLNRRLGANRRLLFADRRNSMDRRYLRRKAAANNLDRRFAARPDRRSDLDRRIRGWVDRRCIDERRGLPSEPDQKS